MRPVVIDANVIVALYMQDPLTSAAREALMTAYAGGADLHAPNLLLVETANALWKRVRRKDLDGEAAMQAMRNIASLENLRVHATDGYLTERALDLALEHGFTAYDAVYVALALELHQGIVLSGDRRFVKQGKTAGLPLVEPHEFSMP